MDWQLATGVILAVVAVVGSAVQIREVIPRLRATIKTDLEILALLPDNHPQRAELSANIDRRLQQIAIPRQRRLHRPGELVAGLLWMGFFFFWAEHFWSEGLWPLGFLLGIAGLVGLGGVLNGFQPKPIPSQADAATED